MLWYHRVFVTLHRPSPEVGVSSAMIVGVPTEVKKDEYRVGMRPVGAEVLTKQGHTVLVQSGAGLGSGFPDDQYQAAGAKIVGAAADVWGKADMVVKVKEPQPQEIPMI